jgi:2-amino-4-hydroxy-6-hydroxymethyldihydropteridine diphosphokinase
MPDTESLHRAFIALGSNLGVGAYALNGALADINQLPDTRVLQVSPWYRSQAIGGPADQPDYLNAVCEIDTALEPNSLLQALQHIEHCFGRERQVRWGPRTLDLDIICYDDLVSEDPELTLPHPRAHQRAFVIQPLADLAPTLCLQGQSLTHWLEQTRDQTAFNNRLLKAG